MLLIILGLLILVFAFTILKQNPAMRPFGAIAKIAGIVIIVIGAASSMFQVIDAGEVGVKTVFGKVDQDVLYSGLNVINPIAKVTTFDIKTQNYTMSGTNDEGDQRGDDALRVLSADGLEVVIDLSVLFRAKGSETPTILKQIGTDYVQKIVRPITRTAIRDNAVAYDAVELYSSKREEFQNKIFNTINKRQIEVWN